jgi:hypothetical protein
VLPRNNQDKSSVSFVPRQRRATRLTALRKHRPSTPKSRQPQKSEAPSLRGQRTRAQPHRTRHARAVVRISGVRSFIPKTNMLSPRRLDKIRRALSGASSDQHKGFPPIAPTARVVPKNIPSRTASAWQPRQSQPSRHHIEQAYRTQATDCQDSKAQRIRKTSVGTIFLVRNAV